MCKKEEGDIIIYSFGSWVSNKLWKAAKLWVSQNFVMPIARQSAKAQNLLKIVTPTPIFLFLFFSFSTTSKTKIFHYIPLFHSYDYIIFNRRCLEFRCFYAAATPDENCIEPEQGETEYSCCFFTPDLRFSLSSSEDICLYRHSALQNAFSPLQ